MEYILLDDVKEHIQELKKYIRPVGVTEHSMLVKGGVRDVDFLLSEDKKWVLPSDKGLSFATSMKKFKSVYRLKSRLFLEVDVFAIDDMTAIPQNMKIIRDRPGHASLIVTQKMLTTDLVKNLELISQRAEHIGRIRVM